DAQGRGGRSPPPRPAERLPAPPGSFRAPGRRSPPGKGPPTAPPTIGADRRCPPGGPKRHPKPPEPATGRRSGPSNGSPACKDNGGNQSPPGCARERGVPGWRTPKAPSPTTTSGPTPAPGRCAASPGPPPVLRGSKGEAAPRRPGSAPPG